MTRYVKYISKKAGMTPESLVHVGDKKVDMPKITVIDYDKNNFEEKELLSIEECIAYKNKSSVTWINVNGLNNVNIIEKLGECFNIHPLVLEDVLHTAQMPKFEDFGTYLFSIIKMLSYDDIHKKVDSEQMSIIWGKNFVISFQEKEGDVFNLIRDRIKTDKGKVRKMGSDYLAYSLLDAIIDNYFVILEKLGEDIEVYEENLIERPETSVLKEVYVLKRETLLLRKSVWPLRDVISKIEHSESELLGKETDIYVRDLYDHTIQIIETIETFRDMISGMLDLYLSSLSNRMNEVMKVLTIISTVFIPLTFISGIYGMNFRYMPELGWEYGYLYVWILIAVIGAMMFFYFRKKKWL